MPFFIIFSCIGTILTSFTSSLIFAYILGASISMLFIKLINISIVNNKETRTKIQLFTAISYDGIENIFIRSFIYSGFLFLTFLLTSRMNLNHAYWAPLTFAVLLRPKETAVMHITILRFSGSILGSCFIVFIFNILNISDPIFNYIVFALITIMLPSFLDMNYMLKTFGITIFILFLLEQTEYINNHNYMVPLARIYETFIGGLMAIIASVFLVKLRN